MKLAQNPLLSLVGFTHNYLVWEMFQGVRDFYKYRQLEKLISDKVSWSEVYDIEDKLNKAVTVLEVDDNLKKARKWIKQAFKKTQKINKILKKYYKKLFGIEYESPKSFEQDRQQNKIYQQIALELENTGSPLRIIRIIKERIETSRSYSSDARNLGEARVSFEKIEPKVHASISMVTIAEEMLNQLIVLLD